MWTLVMIFAKEKALPWLLSNWKHLGWPLACIFAMLYFRSCGQLAELSKPKQAEQAQSLTATAKAASTGKVTIPGRPAMPCPPEKTCPECPSVTVDFGSSAEVGTTASQESKVGPVAANYISLWPGIGYLNEPYISMGLQYKDFQAEGLKGVGEKGEWGVKASYQILRFPF